jgi:hypothetical protein
LRGVQSGPNFTIPYGKEAPKNMCPSQLPLIKGYTHLTKSIFLNSALTGK